ncbi:carboxymuconolactone decarboxylase family protein [Cognatishimia activa]|uniref:4-carboxymuconolactone decarboxylase n=1 Tax=Cognatishimia activa TaxID=1715691 RepID=A0A0P1J5B1_9RHOB|nr:carboxymuconolactone decarboxylase family protein [Cognatishimia activa]CUJ22040.1 4-carboxymuconolactone decarboxylase [Cognatishimia activa]CUK25441.1 4-carboxymuconolactone decarboxylase [Cognatishimia activa]
MSDSKNPFEQMIQQYQDMAKSMNPALESFTPKGFEKLWPTMPKDMMEMFFGNTLNKDGLDAKTRLLLNLAALTVLGGQADAQIRVTVRHLLEAGATHQEIIECVGQMSMFAGIPAMTQVMEIVQDILGEDEEDDA